MYPMYTPVIRAGTTTYRLSSVVHGLWSLEYMSSTKKDESHQGNQGTFIVVETRQGKFLIHIFQYLFTHWVNLIMEHRDEVAVFIQ